MICCVCRKFLPPGFTKPIKGTKIHKCIFCIQGKDKIMSISKVHGGIQWDIKDKIVNEYKLLLDKIANNEKIRKNFIANTER